VESPTCSHGSIPKHNRCCDYTSPTGWQGGLWKTEPPGPARPARPANRNLRRRLRRFPITKFDQRHRGPRTRSSSFEEASIPG